VIKSRRRFGPLSYTTAGIALLVILSRPFWETTTEQFAAWRLSRQLRDPTKATREQAATKLVRLGPAATSWVIRAMRNGDPRVRETACSILMQTMPERPDEALAALLAAAKDSDPLVQWNALMQLEQWIARAGSSPEKVVVDPAIRALGDALGDISGLVRWQAASSLATVGPQARSVVGALDRALDDPEKPVRIGAAEALLRIDADRTRARVIAALSPMLKDPPRRLEHYKLVAILTSAQGQEATAAMLVPLLKDADPETRMTVIQDLTTHCSGARAVRPAMIEALRGDDPGLRQEAAVFFLAREPDTAGRTIDALLERITNPTEGSHFGWAVVSRLRLYDWSAVKPLTRKLLELLDRSTRPATRAFAIAALGETRREALAAVPLLMELSKEKDLEVASRAVEALVKIDPRAAAKKIPTLCDWVTPAHHISIRQRAIASLRDLGPDARTAIPALIDLASDEDRAISAGAIEAISKIDPPTGKTLKQAIVRSDVESDDE
jgi:HEAT repeat protein